jgi:hypothetical protein
LNRPARRRDQWDRDKAEGDKSMSESATPEQSGRHRFLFVALSCYLIATFLYRTLTPAHEYAMRTEQLMTIGLDILAVIGLAGLRAHGSKGLYWAGLPAGIGLLLIRLNSDASWWTGHLMYSLPPR